jgi:hypothetical protein
MAGKLLTARAALPLLVDVLNGARIDARIEELRHQIAERIEELRGTKSR